MTAFDDLTWQEAMRQVHEALMELALLERGSQGERYGHPGTQHELDRWLAAPSKPARSRTDADA